MIMAIMGENIHSFSIYFESGESPYTNYILLG